MLVSDWPPDRDHQKAHCSQVIFYLALHFSGRQLHMKLPLSIRDRSDVGLCNGSSWTKQESSPFRWQRRKTAATRASPLKAGAVHFGEVMYSHGRVGNARGRGRKGGLRCQTEWQAFHRLRPGWGNKKHFVPDNKSGEPRKWANKAKKKKMQSGMSEEKERKTKIEISENDCKGAKRDWEQHLKVMSCIKSLSVHLNRWEWWTRRIIVYKI